MKTKEKTRIRNIYGTAKHLKFIGKTEITDESYTDRVPFLTIKFFFFVSYKLSLEILLPAEKKKKKKFLQQFSLLLAKYYGSYSSA